MEKETEKEVDKGKYDQKKWGKYLEKAEKRRNHEKTEKVYSDYDDDIINDIKNFENKKGECLKKSLGYYKYATTTDFFDKNYISLNEKHIKHALSRCKIMIMTANPIEKAVLHHKMIDNGSIIMTRILCETTAYYIFKWNKYWVAHIHQSQTGAGKDMGTNATINDSLKFFTPNVIISLGIAFGIDYKTQNIGDVLVSRRIFPYSENKRDEDIVKPDRSQDKTIDDWLHVRLENAIGFLDEVTYGDILSGGSVMSSSKEKDRICLGYTKEDYIIGGEMEGSAVFQYAKRVGIPGVVIKGICDWGTVKNGIHPENPKKEKELKHSLQAFAMVQAVEKCKPLFNDKELFSLPKDIATKRLKKKYYFCVCGLIITQLIMIIHGINLLQFNYDFNTYVNITGKFFNQPIVWFALPFVFLLILVVVGIANIIPKLIWSLQAYLEKKLKVDIGLDDFFN